MGGQARRCAFLRCRRLLLARALPLPQARHKRLTAPPKLLHSQMERIPNCCTAAAGQSVRVAHQGVNCGLCGDGGAPCGSRSSSTGTTSFAASRAADAPLCPSNTANREYWSAARPQAEQRAREGASEASLLAVVRPRHSGEDAASLPGHGRWCSTTSTSCIRSQWEAGTVGGIDGWEPGQRRQGLSGGRVVGCRQWGSPASRLS